MEKINVENLTSRAENTDNTYPAHFKGFKESNGVKEYKNLMKEPNLENMPQLDVLCGKQGGLPFDYLMTDVFSGCLPIRSICYANCTAAEFWISQGYDFGKRTINRFDENAFRESVASLPDNQKWLRQGWASDCSIRKEGWTMVENAARILKERDINLLIITKTFTAPDDEILESLASLDAEIRVSISAVDTSSEHNLRTNFLKKFQDLGGKSIPYLMTAKYASPELTENQNAIIKWIEDNDFIAAEHPLRLNRKNPLIKQFAEDGFWHSKFPNEYWFGRILSGNKNFLLPPPTCLKPEYPLSYKKFSDVKNNQIEGLDSNLPTYEQLLSGEDIKTTNINKHATYNITQKI